ncbi:MAG: hypothetical protein HC869_17220 [Rhodospirillales bacterium]|nr:hypothetical protein [Rhodospirillales bacterium]
MKIALAAVLCALANFHPKSEVVEMSVVPYHVAEGESVVGNEDFALKCQAIGDELSDRGTLVKAVVTYSKPFGFVWRADYALTENDDDGNSIVLRVVCYFPSNSTNKDQVVVQQTVVDSAILPLP